MATQFDSNGFSAVTAFFGTDDDVTKKEHRKNFNETPDKPSTKGRRGAAGRLGVGASTEGKGDEDNLEQKSDWQTDESKRKLLNVGKRKRIPSGYDFENEVSDEGDGAIDESGTDEEDGRTSAIKSKVKKTSMMETTLAQTVARDRKKTSKKKKPGKKERSAAASSKEIKNRIQNALGESHKDEVTREEEGESMTDTDQINAEGNSNDENDEELAMKVQDGENDELQASMKKRKRRKVRSRQKNVRKDKRSAIDKPSYLIPGRSNYVGRPLTPETRTYLNLPPSKSSMIRKKIYKEGIGRVTDGLSRRETNDAVGLGHAVGLGLAVDEFLNVGVNEQSSRTKCKTNENRNSEEVDMEYFVNNKKKTSLKVKTGEMKHEKKRKTKYKNLM